MTELDKEINYMIMNEMGLGVGPNNVIYDEENGNVISINGMNIVAPGSEFYGKAMEFDPHNNRKLMGCLFGYFIDKIASEGDMEVMTYYPKNRADGECIECRMTDNSLLRSKAYKRDSLKYTDLMIQLNGRDCGDELKKYDVLPINSSIRKKK